MKIYHQAGHNTNWNIDSYSEEKAGDGIIFSPVHYPKNKIEEANDAIKKVSIFDPQYYIPDSQKKKLHSYEFFPEKITDGFSTTDFEAVAQQSAQQCLNFQVENKFESIIIPARYFSDLVTDYIEKQKTFSVEPFMSEINNLGEVKDVFITLPTTVQMIQDKGYRLELLNWIASYPKVSGVYFLNQIREATKQITHFENLNAHVSFIQDIQECDLKVIVGYCNTESILLSILDPYALTIGAYENTRNFSVDKFLEDDSDKRGPAPRIYLPKLLNWVRYDTVVEIKDDFPELWKEVYTQTGYMDNVFSSSGRPHFTQPALYKHHFQLIARQLRELKKITVSDRVSRVESMIREASKLYSKITDAGVIFFDDNCKGDHLPGWNRVLRKFRP